jgi:hypothetical protein
MDNRTDSASGRSAKWLVAAAALLLVVLGAGHVWVTNRGLLDHAFIRAVETLLTVSIFAALVLFTTRRMYWLLLNTGQPERDGT